MNKSFVSKPMYAVTRPSVGNPFNRVDFNPERHAYLEGLKFADKYPSTGEREFEMIMSEPYFSELERAEEVKSPNPSLLYRTRDEYDTKNRQHVRLIRDLFID